jgi:hypothetical protein
MRIALDARALLEADKDLELLFVHDLNWIVNPRYNTHNPFFRLFGGAFYRAGLTAAMHTASRILTVSHATRHAILEYAPWHASKIRIAYHGIDRSRIYPLEQDMAYGLLAYLIEPGTPFVLTVGQGTPLQESSARRARLPGGVRPSA